MLSSWFAQAYFDQAQVLVPAVRLVGLPGITCQPQPRLVGYYHLLLEDHHVLLAEGLPCKSLYPSRRALQGLMPQARREILALMPHLQAHGPSPPAARLLVPGPDVPKAKARQFFRRALRPKGFDLWTRSAPVASQAQPL